MAETFRATWQRAVERRIRCVRVLSLLGTSKMHGPQRASGLVIARMLYYL
jgi:hypothetical protein